MKLQAPKSWDEWLLQGALIVAAVLTLLDAIVPDFPTWPLTPLIFIGIFLLLVRMQDLRKLATDSVDMRATIATISTELHAMQRRFDDAAKSEHAQLGVLVSAAAVMDVRFSFYRSAEEFYAALKYSLEFQKHRKLDATYIRRFPWSDYESEGAQAYFDYTLEWAKQPNHSVRRICVDNNERLNKWILERHRDNTATRYMVRILPWPIEADLVNLAIMDGEHVFVAFSGIGEDLDGGFSFRHKEIATFLQAYFVQLWDAAQPIDTWVKQKGLVIPGP